MKKFSWILALLAAFAVLFVGVGCGDPKEEEDEGPLAEVTVFDLATDEIFQAFAIGAIDNKKLEETLLVGAGSPGLKVVATPEKASQKSLELTSAATWGDGIDLRNAAAFKFREGDVITMSGEVLTMTKGNIQINRKAGGAAESTVGGKDTQVKAVGAFSYDITLAAADITALKAGDPAGLRFEMRNDPANIVVRIDELKVVGMRPSTVKPEATDFTITKLLQDEDEVVAVSIVPISDKMTGDITIYYEGIAPTTYAKSTTVPQKKGKYKVTFDITASTGFHAATGLEAGTLEIIIPVKAKLGDFITGLTPAPTWANTEVRNGAFKPVGPLDGNEGAITDWTWVETTDGKLALKVGTDNWRGLHLLTTDFAFAAGDVLEVKVRVTVNGPHTVTDNDSRAVVIIIGDGWDPLDGAQYFDSNTAGTYPFTITSTFTAQNITNIVGKGFLRIQCNNAAKTFEAFYIDSIKVTHQ